MSYVLQGDDIVQGPPEVSHDPNGNSFVTLSWRGLRSRLEEKVVNEGLHVWQYTITPIEGPIGELRITYPGGSQQVGGAIEFTWRLSSALQQKPLAEHPKYVEAIRNLSASEVDQMNKVIDREIDLDGFSIGSPLVMEYIHKRLRGTSIYTSPDPVFVFQARYQPNTGYAPDFATMGVVYRTRALIAEFGIPNDIANQLFRRNNSLRRNLWRPDEGYWLTQQLDFEAASDGSRVAIQSFLYGDAFDPDLYTIVG